MFCPEGISNANLTDIICILINLAQAIVPVLVGLALLFFFWGLAQWILNMSDSDKHEAGKQRMIWGLVALFFILSIGGLVTILQSTFFGGGSNSLHTTPPGFSSNNQFLNNSGSGTLGTDSSRDFSGSFTNTGQGGGSAEGDSFRFVAEPRSTGSIGSSGGGGGGFFDSFIGVVRGLFSF